MREYAVVGAGPVGRVVAGVLAAGGGDVTVCELNDAVRERIGNNGIAITGARELSLPPNELSDIVRNVSDLADDPPETLILCVKATAIPLVCSAIAEFAPHTMTVVSWQNGIDTERVIAESIPAVQVVRAVVNFGVSEDPDGTVRMSFEHPPHMVQELLPDSAARADRVATAMSDAGLATVRADNLVGMVWKKAILNATLNALCGLTGFTMEDATRDSYAWELADHILKESVAVARANEIWLGSDFYRWATEYMHAAGPHRPSMLSDLQAGRRTEIDFINGKIVEYGRNAGVPTPYNETMVALVKAREKQARMSR